MNAPIHFKLNSIAKGAAGFVFSALLAMTAATAQVASGTTGIDATGNAQSELAGGGGRGAKIAQGKIP